MAKSDVLTKKLDGYGQAPSNPPTHAIYCYYPPRDQLEPGQHRNMVVVSFKLFGAKRFIEIMSEGTKLEPLGENRVMAQNDIEIYCPQGLDQVLNYRYRGDEEDWMPTADHADQVNRIRKRLMDEPERIVERDEGGNVIKAERPKKEKVEKAPKETRSGLVDMNAIAKDLGYDPKDCRQALRKAKVEKPSVGWAWPADKVDEIKKVIKANVKIRN